MCSSTSYFRTATYITVDLRDYLTTLSGVRGETNEVLMYDNEQTLAPQLEGPG